MPSTCHPVITCVIRTFTSLRYAPNKSSLIVFMEKCETFHIENCFRPRSHVTPDMSSFLPTETRGMPDFIPITSIKIVKNSGEGVGTILCPLQCSHAPQSCTIM